jgi:hypothetical protein
VKADHIKRMEAYRDSLKKQGRLLEARAVERCILLAHKYSVQNK